ncbi:MAG: dihydrofolate reductase family protein, partial [Muribaculaceae bacterium]|nr:dihydrofolate reductase family protein [Muribaculaceae bacterium]
VLVEGGAALLQSFIDNDLWDDMRIETAPVRLGSAGGTKAPVITHGCGMITPHSVEQIGGNSVSHYINLHSSGVKNL